MAIDYMNKDLINTFEIHIDRKNFFRRQTLDFVLIKNETSIERGPHQLYVKDIILEEIPDDIAVPSVEFKIHNSACQDLIDKLYHLGFRPSDDLRKDDLIRTLQKEIDKRDEMIDKLMKQFVYRENLTTRRLGS